MNLKSVKTLKSVYNSLNLIVILTVYLAIKNVL